MRLRLFKSSDTDKLFDPTAHCPRGRKFARGAGHAACSGINAVMYFDPSRRNPDGSLKPETEMFCCQNNVLLRTEAEKVIDQRVSATGQLLLKVAERPIPGEYTHVTQFLDVPDPIPEDTVVIGPDGERITRTPMDDIR